MSAPLYHRQMARILVACCLLGACSGAVHSPVPPPPLEVQPPFRATLHVAMFPYIPDSGKDGYASLLEYVEENFERKCPTIDLVLRPLNQADDFYDLDVLTDWLTRATEEGGYDLVEIDTVILGDLVTAGLIGPWPQTGRSSDWHPVAACSVRINDAIYGIPHLLCGHFLITRNKDAAMAKNVSELSSALRSVENNTPDLMGNVLGSWNMPSLFLDAWEDAHPQKSPAYALHKPIDESVLRSFKQFTSLCEHEGKNPCLDGTYDDENPAPVAEQFARGWVDALFGYSEYLFFVLSTATDNESIFVTAAPIGDGKYPLLFTDAFVVRRGASRETEVAANLFIDFINSPQVQETILTSADVSPTATPRYLLPATRSVFDAPRLKNDRLYQSLRQSIARAEPFPNTGFLNTRKTMRDALRKALEQP